MKRPVIGITCYVERARFTAWDVPASLLPQSYVDRVTAAGGQPVLLPPAGAPGSLVDVLDGLIVAGGGDVDPARYGEPAHPETGYIRDFRDEAELALVAAALDRGLPFLGICRGMQVLNVHLGGSLHQHLPDVLGHTGHAPAPGEYGRIPVEILAGSALAKVTGATALEPAHYHHQAIDRLGEGLSVSARTGDGCVEAVELAGHPFALAVQWHPEVDADTGLFASFVDAAALGGGRAHDIRSPAMDISGKRIAFTGRLRDLRGYGAPVSRTDAALLVEGLGAKALRAVSPRADLIVAGLNARPDPVKAKGIPVLDEKIFGRFLGATPVVDPGEFADPAAIAEADPDKLRAILEAADWDAFTPERDLPGLRERLRAIEADQGVTEAHLLATAKLTEGGYRAVAKLCHPHQHRGPVRSAALSPDGRWLAIGSAAGPGRWTEDLAIGGAIEVFEVAEGRVVNVIGRRYGAGAATGLDAEGRRDALRWSADTRRIAAVYDTDRFGVWEAGALDYPEADADITTGRDGWPAFALSPDGRHAWIDAATGGAAPGVIVNVETGRVAWDPTDTAAHRPYATEFTTFPPGPDTVVAHRVRRCHGWSPDGSRLAFIGVGAAFAVDLADGSIAWSLDHDGEAAAFSPCGRFVACAHGDGTVLADARTGEVLSRIDAAARDLVWSPGGARLALLGGDAVHIVETGDGSVRGLPIVAVVRDAVMPDVTGFAFAPGEPRAAVRTTEGVEVWSLDGEPARSAGLPAFAGTTGVLWGDGDTIVHIGPGGVAFTRSDGTVIGAFAFAIPPGPSPVDVVGGSTGARMGYEQCFALDEETWAVSFPEGRTVLVPPGRESDVDERLTWSAGSRHAWPLRWGRPTVVTDIPAAHANLVAERSVEAWAFERIVSGD